MVPKRNARETGITSGKHLKITYTGDKIILELIEGVAEKYYGLFKVDKPLPEDLDELVLKDAPSPGNGS